MAKGIGAILAQKPEQNQHLQPCLTASQAADLMTRHDLTRDEARDLRLWGLSQPPVPAATKEQLAKHLRFLDASLPSRNADQETAQMRFAVYYRMLGGYTNAALSYMTERAIREHDWFPTVNQCLSILEQYVAPTTQGQLAVRKADNAINAAFERWLSGLDAPVDQSYIDGAPVAWKRIAECRMKLWQNDGIFTQRLRRAS